MIKIIGAVCLGKEPRICGVFGQILVLAVSISILCILAVSCSKISQNKNMGIQEEDGEATDEEEQESRE